MQCDLIYDVGFHHGEALNFMKKGFKVVAIEAHRALYQAGTHASLA